MTPLEADHLYKILEKGRMLKAFNYSCDKTPEQNPGTTPKA
jgi:hypothetical protein